MALNQAVVSSDLVMSSFLVRLFWFSCVWL